MDERVSKRGKPIEWEEDEENLKWIGMNMRATKSWIVDADTYVYVFDGMSWRKMQLVMMQFSFYSIDYKYHSKWSAHLW